MIELGELEKRHVDFEAKNTRIMAASVEGQKAAQKTQTEHPHLTIISDHDRKLVNALGTVQRHAYSDGSDGAAATTILVDAKGTVRWLYRPDLAIAPRFSLNRGKRTGRLAQTRSPRSDHPHGN